MRIKAMTFTVLCMYMLSCTTTSSPQYVGVYQIDLVESKLGTYAMIDSIRDLKLFIRKDSTFYFSKDVPFVFQQSGVWKMHHFEAIDHPPKDECYLYYGEDNREDVLMPKDDGVVEFFINTPLSKENQTQVELLHFKRIGGID